MSQPAPRFTPSPDDAELIAALRRGDEAAFLRLVERFHPALVRVAGLYVPEPAMAEEVAQETWLAVLQGLPRFEGRSSLRTWIFAILANRAKTRAQREHRSLPFSALEDAGPEADEPAVDPARFRPPDDPDWPGHWASRPASWEAVPERLLLWNEMQAEIRGAIQALPPNQRAVITLRDLDGFSAEEACNVLGLTETNQRVLLHRARSKVRRALELYVATEF